VTGYTGFSGDPAEQSGNYLALHATADDGAVIQAKLQGSPLDWVTLDEDGIIISRLHDNSGIIQFRATKGGVTQEITLSLFGVVKQSA
jgi:hypothetical protein